MLRDIWRLIFGGQSKAWCDGNDAYYAGYSAESNPYHEETGDHEHWNDGCHGRR